MNPNKTINNTQSEGISFIKTKPSNVEYLDLIEDYKTALFLLKQAADIIDTLDNLELYSEEWLNIINFLNQNK